MDTKIIKWQAKEPFSGYVELAMPRQKDRIKFIKSLKYKTEIKDDQIEIDNQEGINYDAAEKISEYVESHVKGIALKYEPNGMMFDNMADLELYEEGIEVINALGRVLMNGVKLGNG